MTGKTRAKYSLEFKLEAVRLATAGPSIAATAKILKAKQQGRMGGAAFNLVSPEQMEIARLRAELARVKMERDILARSTANFAKQRD